MSLIARPLKRYAQPVGSKTVRWRGRVELLLDGKWLLTTECSVIGKNDGSGVFVAGPERKLPDDTYFKQVRFSEDVQHAIITGVKNDPDPKPRVDDPEKSMRQRDDSDEFDDLPSL